MKITVRNKTPWTSKEIHPDKQGNTGWKENG